MSEQLSLGIGLRDSARFSNFVVAENREAVHALECLAEGRGESQLLIHGAPGTGRTHLLQACCHRAATSGRSAAYLPLAEAVDLPPEMVLGWEQYALVCIDDVEAVTTGQFAQAA